MGTTLLQNPRSNTNNPQNRKCHQNNKCSDRKKRNNLRHPSRNRLGMCRTESMARSQIDTEQGIISAKGCKGHASRTFKFKQRTAELLRIYMHKHPEEHPFPTPKAISLAWRQHRNRTARKLNEPELKNVLMRNLRNYSGAQLYFKTQDPILIMRHLGHKKLETTMH
jgi:hypothetical protein